MDAQHAQGRRQGGGGVQQRPPLWDDSDEQWPPAAAGSGGSSSGAGVDIISGQSYSDAQVCMAPYHQRCCYFSEEGTTPGCHWVAPQQPAWESCQPGFFSSQKHFPKQCWCACAC